MLAARDERDDGKRFDRGEWRVEVVQLDDVDDEARTVPYTETRYIGLGLPGELN